MNKNTTVCIIGAGAAGMSAAHFLRKKGYRNIIVLEKDNGIGGKCCTVTVDGRNYEMGAGIHTKAYRVVSEIMKDVDIKSDSVNSFMAVDIEKRKFYTKPLKLNFIQSLVFGLECCRLIKELLLKRKVIKPGFAGIHKDFQLPFSEYAEKKGIKNIAKRVSVFVTAFGYGYYEEVPAAYIMKYFPLMRPARELLDTGYRGLWNKVAEGIDVRTGIEIKSISRNGVVTISTQHEDIVCDKVILACPMDNTLSFLDASPLETKLFNKIRYFDYHVFLAEVKNLPKQRYAFVPKFQTSKHAGRTMFWYRRWQDTDVISFYSLGKSSTGMRTEMDHEEIRKNIENEITALGGQIVDYKVEKIWKYFPHVTPEDFASGYYDSFESMQGELNTFYTGEILNFSTVESVSAYSKQLINQHF